MCIRYLGFGLLIWFPVAIHVQTSNQPCPAPRLEAGYWVPVQDFYKHETKLPYVCNKGRKPAAEGWWATSTCLNGIWSPQPQCIDEKACIAADIANAKYTEQQGSWYEDGHTIRITCNEEYDPKGWKDTAKCIDGKWSPVLVCEKSLRACGAPPQIPHAVIILQGYQDLFAAGTELQYECEDGYTVEGGDTKTSIHCIARKWTDGPILNGMLDWVALQMWEQLAVGHNLKVEPADRVLDMVEVQLAVRHNLKVELASRPGTGHGGGSAGSGTQAEGGGRGTIAGGPVGSAVGGTGRGTQPEREVNNCGPAPVVPNADFVGISEMVVRYQCFRFYKRVGPEMVECQRDGTWSKVPACKGFLLRLHHRGEDAATFGFAENRLEAFERKM
ncbi:coagulation factor XIII B chain-like [Cyclopterus lumpus]|uniref:coagulation factor XIII B chain-like n=1 Tax=Cyclopterus lumpus TaxID=8103 RepID=UPI001486196E|nr:coagulation factor XIII B chain-like [Cyclopterus lumpus]